MDEQFEKLISHSGGYGKYQIIILIIAFFTWFSLAIHSTSLPMLEKVPLVSYINEEGERIEDNLNYDICQKEYTIIKNYKYSWIIELNISCIEAEVGLIGSFTFAGLTCGCFLFSLITKYIHYKPIIIISIFCYVFFLFLTTIINNYYFRLFCLIPLGIANGLGLFSSLTLINESVCSKKRSLFGSILNIGYSICPIIYTPLYAILGNWRFVFWFENIVALTCGFMFIIILEDSPRTYFIKDKKEEGVNILKRIASFNGKSEEFEKIIKSKEFEDFLKKNDEEIKNSKIETKTKYGYYDLIKYPSIRYKFIIFSFMFMSTNFLTNSVVINTKSMIGNMYINIMTLYFTEIIGSLSSGFIINIPRLGRKKSIMIFYCGIILGFILYLLFYNFGFNPWALLGAMIIIRYSITGVYNTFYVFFMESYPTPVRALGFGLNSTFGNLAGIISPIVIEYVHIYILYSIFLVICCINCLLTFFLKETVGKAMRDTIDDITDIISIEEDTLVPNEEKNNNNLEKEEKNT